MSWMNWKRAAAAFIFLSVAASLPAHGCSCVVVDARMCTRATWPVIFTGKVTSLDRSHLPAGLAAHFAVQRTYKGSVGKETVVYTNGDDGACGYSFEEGKSYVVYTDANSNGSFSVNLCGDTHLFSDATPEELQFLDGLNRGSRIGSISGTLTDQTVYQEPKPLHGIKVVATDGKHKYSARTDKKGKFEIEDLPAGKYEMTALLPDELALDPEGARDRHVEVVPHGCSDAELKAVNGATISGQLTGSPGQKVSGVTVAAVGESFALAQTDDSGRFVIRGLEPGKYVVGINIGYAYPNPSSPYIQTYYPGTRDGAKATKLTVGRGTLIRDINFALPPTLPVVSIAIETVNEDGTPAGGSYLARDVAGSGTSAWDTQTDQTGHATAQFLKGVVYLIQGHTRDTCAPQVEVGPDEIPNPLRFVMTAENCRLQNDKLLRENFLREVDHKFATLTVTVKWEDGSPAHGATVLTMNPKQGQPWVALTQTTDKNGYVEMPVPLASRFTLVVRARDSNDFGCYTDTLLVNTDQGVMWREGVPRSWVPADWDSRERLQSGPVELVLSGPSCPKH